MIIHYTGPTMQYILHCMIYQTHVALLPSSGELISKAA